MIENQEKEIQEEENKNEENITEKEMLEMTNEDLGKNNDVCDEVDLDKDEEEEIVVGKADGKDIKKGKREK